jgi:hypothetical protein
VHLRIAEEIRAVPDVIGAGGIIPFLACRMLLANSSAIAAARGFRRRIPALSCIGRSRSVLTGWATRSLLARIAGVLRVIRKGVARH